ncbi:MAG: hypothetical protein K1X26_10070 [Chitinophagales bacterium]|nr:hypothetical protein [Chitinophagales bacterium]HMU99226.1 hypothetical protein [Chitinophagales bacterium]HMW95491.1 hypothetical protein [Chitinophagales bacterium]HMY42485.1 hypothetical protein [Chitinophagales bacterium]HMZ93859.1 hypothetical protein [Chitinophagales bacterium]
MKKIILICITLCFYFNINAKNNKAPKPENRFSFSAGIGSAYSIWNGKLTDGEDGIYYQKKKPMGFNLLGEFTYMMRRNFYISMGMDYNQYSRYYPPYLRYYNSNLPYEIPINYTGRLIDRNMTIQFTANKKFKIKKHSIHLGTGLFFMNTIEPIMSIGVQAPLFETNLSINERNNWEFGFPFQIAYEYAINDRWNIGIKSQYQYILSTFNSQNIYFSPYFRLNIQKRNK